MRLGRGELGLGILNLGGAGALGVGGIVYLLFGAGPHVKSQKTIQIVLGILGIGLGHEKLRVGFADVGLGDGHFGPGFLHFSLGRCIIALGLYKRGLVIAVVEFD